MFEWLLIKYIKHFNKVHRDIRASNIIKSNDGPAYLIDWGFAIKMEEEEDPPMYGGTKTTASYRVLVNLKKKQGFGTHCFYPLPEDDLHSLWKTVFLAANPHLKTELLQYLHNTNNEWWITAKKFWDNIAIVHPRTSYYFRYAQMISCEGKDYHMMCNVLEELCENM